VRGVVNRFGRQLVHDGLDMQVRRGEVFGILGGSGSGKSVLLRTILGLRRPQAGQVLVEGADMTRLSGEALRAAKARYGVTFQAGALFTALTVLQNVQLPMIEHLSARSRGARRARDAEAAAGGPAGGRGLQVPVAALGGMVKRAALARALALDPHGCCSSTSRPRASTRSAPRISTRC
jgi:phospholipid/cholesterol/gamma-HCH transport system ATP-binding protein